MTSKLVSVHTGNSGHRAFNTCSKFWMEYRVHRPITKGVQGVQKPGPVQRVSHRAVD